MNFFSRRRILLRMNLLEAVPVRACQHEVREDGSVAVVVPKFRSEWINQLFLRHRSRNFRVNLDRFGSATWLQIDGTSNVDRICRRLESQFAGELSETEERVAKFLGMLYDQRYITFREISK